MKVRNTRKFRATAAKRMNRPSKMDSIASGALKIHTIFGIN